MEQTIKDVEKKIKRLFIARIVMWVICAAGCVYWIIWSCKLYDQEPGELDIHVYATNFRPHFNLGITISIVSNTISLILRLISDKQKRDLKNLLCNVR